MEEIINSVMQSPENTNPNVLRGQLQGISGGSGGSGGGAMYATFTEDNGTWSCDKTYAELRTAYDAGHPVFARYNDLNDFTEGGFTMCAPMCDVVYVGVPALYAKTVVQQGYMGSISVTMHTGQFVIADVGIMAEIESYVVSLQR